MARSNKPDTLRPSRIVAAERRRNALGLRRNGATYEQIAEALDISVSTARNYIKDALEAITKDIAETADEIRELELQRLDHMLRVLAPKIETSAAEGDYRPMQMQLRIQERRAKLLGLDAPSKHDHSGKVQVAHGIQRGEIDDLEQMWRDSALDGEAIEIPASERLVPGD